MDNNNDTNIDTNIDTNTNEHELTIVDIEELRRALGAEAELSSITSGPLCQPTCMCVQWF